MARRSSITQADIMRLIKAVDAAGFREHVIGIKIERDSATLLFGKPAEPVTEKATGTADDTTWRDVDAA